MAATRNTGSGSWLSTSTWNTGTIPGEMDGANHENGREEQINGRK